jgi:hypothetical protein
LTDVKTGGQNGPKFYRGEISMNAFLFALLFAASVARAETVVRTIDVTSSYPDKYKGQRI